MVRSAAKPRVSNHEASSFETRSRGALLRMRGGGAMCCSRQVRGRLPGRFVCCAGGFLHGATGRSRAQPLSSQAAAVRRPLSSQAAPLMVRSAAKPRVSNHGASSFETRSCGALLRMRGGGGMCCSRQVSGPSVWTVRLLRWRPPSWSNRPQPRAAAPSQAASLMVRSAAKPRVSNHGASSFETRSRGALLRMRGGGAMCCSRQVSRPSVWTVRLLRWRPPSWSNRPQPRAAAPLAGRSPHGEERGAAARLEP